MEMPRQLRLALMRPRIAAQVGVDHRPQLAVRDRSTGQDLGDARQPEAREHRSLQIAGYLSDLTLETRSDPPCSIVGPCEALWRGRRSTSEIGGARLDPQRELSRVVRDI